MLHEFLTSNHDELIARCKGKVAKRSRPGTLPTPIDRGIPIFLEQLIETLRQEQHSPHREVAPEGPTPQPTDIGHAASRHGAELLRHGFTVDQVVHDYGDVCQSVTELAMERNVPMSTDEFRTLNRCLDNAIADAVAEFGRGRELARDSEAESERASASARSDEYWRLIDIAIQSFSAIKTGNIGATGATGALLMHALDELRALAEQTRPEPGRGSDRPSGYYVAQAPTPEPLTASGVGPAPGVLTH